MATIQEIPLRVQAVDLDKEIVIVDDASTDGTREFLADLAKCAEAAPAQMTLRQNGPVVCADNVRILFRD
jgi:GT2 family glycosyltransferase